MNITFSKYQGTGNDFIIIDQMKSQVEFTSSQLQFLCDRRFGVGADGVMLLRPSSNQDFKMVYYNADGNESSMCGNGGRCLAHFAKANGYVSKETSFEAIDGLHKAVIAVEDNTQVSLLMNDVTEVGKTGNDYILNTGSPHYVVFSSGVESIDVFNEGRAIRNSDRFRKEGINVNFVEVMSDGIFVRSYERGVEDETLSCGTGVTASVIAAAESGRISGSSCTVKTKGGNLKVAFNRTNNKYTDIWLIGPAEFVFKAEINL